MLLAVTDVSETLVTGETAIGQIKGVWKYRYAPEIGRRYQIELDVPQIDRKQISVMQTGIPEMRLSGGTVFFTAQIEDIDEVYFLRFSPDGLSMLEILNDDGTIPAGAVISFSCPDSDVGIYPYL